eukprot:03065_6
MTRPRLWLMPRNPGRKDKAVAAAASVRQEKDKAVSEALGAREEAREADTVRKKAEAEADGLRLELDGARLRELQPITLS